MSAVVFAGSEAVSYEGSRSKSEFLNHNFEYHGDFLVQKINPLKIPKSESEFDFSEKTWKQTETLNAFHIISLSEGFDLSPLFEEKKEEKLELRFATTRLASSVISKLEEVAKTGKFNIKKSESMVKLQGMEHGRKGKLAIAAEIFAVTPSFLAVEVKKDHGDTLEYNNFCSMELRPALKDIV